MHKPGPWAVDREPKWHIALSRRVTTRRGWRLWVPASDYTSPIGSIFLVSVLAWSVTYTVYRVHVALGPANAAARPTLGGARERGMGEAREALGPTTELSLAAARVTRGGGEG